jgi:transcriptional regulator with XRE-family HTH domain
MELEKSVFLILFGQRIKELRNNRELSLRQLATRCNIDYSDISKIEKGNRNIQLSTVLELAKGLEIEPKELFDFKLEDKSCK